MPKRQTSIFEYRHTNRNDVQSQESLYIDLTADEDTSWVKADPTDMAVDIKCEPMPSYSQLKNEENLSEEIEQESDIPGEEILITQTKIEETVDCIKYEKEQITCPVCDRDLAYLELNTRIQHVELCLVTPKKEPVETKKRPALPNPQERYKNKKIKVSDKEKVIVHPTSHGERPRPSIPKLKILEFPVDQNQKYHVSVDAFCYAPHDLVSQYFLSHFHSDHYGGITKKWCYYRMFSSVEEYEDESKFRPIIYATKITSRLLTLRFSVDPRFIKELLFDTRYCVKLFDSAGTSDVPNGGTESEETTPGLYVTPIFANHCPGAAIFLFESISLDNKICRTLHCGDFRINKDILEHPLLTKFRTIGGTEVLDNVYLDTTYMQPKYNFPKQELVCETVANIFQKLTFDLASDSKHLSKWLGILKQSRITDFMHARKEKKKFLILVGTYLIGKENLAIAILKKLNNCPIYVLCINSRNDKLDIVKTYDNEHLNQYVTANDLGDADCKCVVHLVPMNIVGSKGEISNYFNHNKYYETFEQCVGLRPTGWSFKEKKREETENDEVIEDYGDLETTINLPRAHTINIIANIMLEQPTFDFTDITAPKAQTTPYNIYSLPYSEHSSFRELSYFVIFFNIGLVIPTVNTHNEWSVKSMNDLIQHWEDIRRMKRDAKMDIKLGESLLQKLNSLDLTHF